jgi:L-rhamnose mutarotase
MARHCLVLDLKDDPALIARYRQWHAPGRPPAVVIKAIRASGIEDMEIHLSGNRLFMILDVGPGFSFEAKAAADAADADVQAWEALMDRFQQPAPAARPGEKWTPAERIFSLREQPQGSAE